MGVLSKTKVSNLRVRKISTSSSESAESQENPLSPRRLVSQFSVPDPKDVKAQLCGRGYVEEEKPLLPSIHVRAASADKLACLAVDCFGVDGKVLPNWLEFPRVLFLMHRWFVPSEELAQKFIDLYQNCDIEPACNVACKHTLNYKHCYIQEYRAKVCQAVRYWISQFPMYFDQNTALTQTIQQLKDVIQLQETSSDLAQLVDTSTVPSFDWIRNMSVRNPLTKHASTTRKVNLVFQNLPPEELAEQLTYMEYKAFRRVTFDDFKHYAIHASLKDNPRLERSIAVFNGLSQWIQCMVLSKTTPQQRADVIVKFVNVATRLYQLQNWNTLMAVVGGLTHSSLARLNKTNACIPSEAQKILLEYTEALSSSNNFSSYRKMLQQSEGFRIPILGVHLKDLVLLNTALTDRVDRELVNFRKMVQLSLTFTELMQVANSTLPVEVNLDLVNTIRLSLDLHYTEDEIYELSLAREPRNSLSSPSTPTKPVMFGDWVAGVSPPDPETINKHVHDMVEAVFKNYDHDKDGFISHAEFEAIAGNFPFIDSFAVLDADQDGMISKAEMKTYFIRANCHALRRCFKHNFHEFTYFKPNFCIHCTGLLWGLIKQGWKCKDCSINAHKHCKDLVVMECRSKPHVSCHSRSLSNGHRDVTVACKRKMSQRMKRHRRSQGTQTDESELLACAALSASACDSASSISDTALGTSLGSVDTPGSVSDTLGSFDGMSGSVEGTLGSGADTPGSMAGTPGSVDGTPEPVEETLGACGSVEGTLGCLGEHDSESDRPGSMGEAMGDAPGSSSRTLHNGSSDSGYHGNVTSLLERTICEDSDDSEALLLSGGAALPDANELTSSVEGGSWVEETEAAEDRVALTEEASENQALKSQMDEQEEEISHLKSHIGVIRQHTVTFILNQMDSLHMQKDSDV